jgi:hypothetical protein
MNDLNRHFILSSDSCDNLSPEIQHLWEQQFCDGVLPSNERDFLKRSQQKVTPKMPQTFSDGSDQISSETREKVNISSSMGFSSISRFDKSHDGSASLPHPNHHRNIAKTINYFRFPHAKRSPIILCVTRRSHKPGRSISPQSKCVLYESVCSRYDAAH